MNTDRQPNPSLHSDASTVLHSGVNPDASSKEESVQSASESLLDKLPTFQTPAAPLRIRERGEMLSQLQPGDRRGDFELTRELGAGTFGRVFLARHLSLDRLVALKVTIDPSGEARALAALEHDHIVRVFGVEVAPQDGLHLLSMQYVPGTTLGQFLETHRETAPTAWTGRDVLAACDAIPTQMDPGVLRERERLAAWDHIEIVCWFGAQLAHALDHAHRQGILHRDVKPSNVLLHTNGRVMLSDFNLASDARREEGQPFGGTLNYMAPEHLDAFNPTSTTPRGVVDARSDIYSLGVVLFEMLTGQRPFSVVPAEGPASEMLKALAEERAREAPSPRRIMPDIPPVLDRIVRRCLEPDPNRRYSTAGELARVLEGCRELYTLNRAAPAGRLTRMARRHPALVASTLPLFPHLIAALAVLCYSAAWVASHPARPVLSGLFYQLALWYSAVVFPITGTLAYLLTRPVWNTYQRLQQAASVEPGEVERVRHWALRKPFWGVILSALGWLPGAILFPLMIMFFAPGAADRDVFLHYALSFVIGGMIALTYTEFVDQFLLLCVAYPVLWIDPVQPQQAARKELVRVERRLRVFQVLSFMVPLTSAIALMVGLVSVGPEQRVHEGYQTFLIVVTCLMGLGLMGAWLGITIGGRLRNVVSSMTTANVNSKS